MKLRYAAAILSIVILTLFSTTATFALINSSKDDTDTRLIDAKIVEVTDAHLSVIARTGVEHVIAVDRAGTKVTLDGRAISLKEVREGDVITVELDALNRVKFAKNISMQSSKDQLASIAP